MMSIYFKRFFTAFLSFIILTAQCALPFSVLAETGGLGEWDDSLHFVVRHWHAVDENGDALDIDTQEFTVVQGYIVPDGTKYRFVYVDDDGNEIGSSEYGDYIQGMDENTGILTLKINPRTNEQFSGVSISAGHDAVTEGNETITITYDPYIHLVKTHIFYITDRETADGNLVGSSNTDLWERYSTEKEKLEHDTIYAYVYTGTDEITVNGTTYTNGDIILGSDGKPVFENNESGIPSEFRKNYKLEKVYNTEAGLHTDKTAYATSDDRTFNLKLESWMGGENPVNVGMILDASGSMAFTSDSLDAINIYEIAGIAEETKNVREKVVKTDEDGNETVEKTTVEKKVSKVEYATDENGKRKLNPKLSPSLRNDPDKIAAIEEKIISNSNKPISEHDWSNIFLTAEQVDMILNKKKTDNSLLATSGYSYYVFDERTDTNEYTPLSYWDGADYDPPTPAPIPTPKPTPKPTPAPMPKSTVYTFTNVTSGSIKSDMTFKNGDVQVTFKEYHTNTSFGTGAAASDFGDKESGFVFPNRIIIGGSGSNVADDSKRSQYFEFTPPSEGTITVYFQTASSSSERRCEIYQEGKMIYRTDPATTEKTMATADVSASNPVYIGGSASIAVYGIVFTPTGGEPTLVTFDAPISGNITSDVEFGNGIKYIGPNGSAYDSGADSKDFKDSDIDFTFPNRIKLGGKSDFDKQERVIEFTPPSPGTIKVYFANAGGSTVTDTRQCIIKQDNTELASVDAAGGGTKAIAEAVIYDDSPVYIGAGTNGITVYGIEFTPIATYKFDDISDSNTTISTRIDFENGLVYYPSSTGTQCSYEIKDANFDDGSSFTSRIKIGGRTPDSVFSGDSPQRVFKFTPKSSGAIKVYFENGGDNERYCIIKQDGKEIVNESAGAKTKAIAAAEVAAGESVYIGCNESIYVYGIVFYQPGQDVEETINPDNVYGFSEITNGTNVEVNDSVVEFGSRLKYYTSAGTDGSSSQPGINRKIDESITFTKGINLGGKSSFTEGSLSRVLEFTPPSAGSVTVYFNTQGANRQCVAYQNGKVVGSGPDSSSGSEDTSITFDIYSELPVYIGSADRIILHGLTFTAGEGLGDPPGPPMYTGNKPVTAGDKFNWVERRTIGFADGTFLSGAYEYKGWYYLTHASDMDIDYYDPDIETAKHLVGIEDNTEVSSEFYDWITLPANANPGPNGGGTDAKYDPLIEDTTTRFYIDEDGYLRCFFAVRGLDATHYSDELFIAKKNSPFMTSYVYENSDSGYIKAEALQRAVGAFNTKLLEASPSSKVSAVRFSTNNVWEDYMNELVMLDWTNDTFESASIFSLHRGEGGTRIGTDSADGKKIDVFKDKPDVPAGLAQYNYGLTGGTYTWTGLQSYIDKLADNADEGADKYLIIFTDGKDNIAEREAGEDINTQNPAPLLAEKLKDDGYTIYAAMLTGGSIAKGSDDYDKALKYLATLTGSEDRVFTTDQAMIDYDVENSADALVQIFINNILKMIIGQLNGYNVQDYIDPRFDLIDLTGNQWHLNANGSVEIKASNGEIVGNYDLSIDGTFASITVSDRKTAQLHYDSAKDMYYLVWTGQTIPGCMASDKKIKVWSSTITIRAKDDFLGGNEVLSNGNADDQNYVYDPKEKADIESGKAQDSIISSGTKDCSGVQEHPSKGFPRTTVNVGPQDGEGEFPVLKYMGEGLSYVDIIERFVDQSNNNEKYYWEYLLRYAKYTTYDAAESYTENEAAYRAKVNEWVQEMINANESNPFTLPYYYLPDDQYNPHNSAGGTLHWKDQLGTLTYTWETDDTFPADGVPTTDTKPRKAKLGVIYTAKTEAQRAENKDNENLVKDSGETDFLYDSEYKPTVGTPITEKEVNETITANLVSGEIVFEMVIDKNAINAVLPYLDESITMKYTAALYRSYNGETEQAGTFKIEYVIDPTKPFNDTVVAHITLTLTDDFDGTSDKFTGSLYGLPIGTYTIVPDSSNSTGSDLLSFGSIAPIEITGDNAGKFLNNDEELETDEENNAVKYPAYAEGNTAWLGTDYPNMPDDDKYTDRRYALFQVPIIAKQFGAIEIKKQVTDKSDYNNEDFEFTITLTPYYGVTIDKSHLTITKSHDTIEDITWKEESNGVLVGTIKLKKDQWVKISNIPAGIGYTVAETDPDNFKLQSVTKTGDGTEVTADKTGEGVIMSDRSAGYTFINNNAPIDLPDSGGRGIRILAIVAGALMLFAAGYVYSRKEKYNK